jgi:hypothetical protein
VEVAKALLVEGGANPHKVSAHDSLASLLWLDRLFHSTAPKRPLRIDSQMMCWAAWQVTVDGMTARTLAYFHGCPQTAAVIEVQDTSFPPPLVVPTCADASLTSCPNRC